MAQPIEKWLPSVLYFPVMMLIGLFVMWQCQTNMVVLVAITGGIIFVYHAVALVRGRNSIFWPGISWSLGYFLIGVYYFYGRGAAGDATWLFTLATVSMVLSAHHWRYSPRITVWPGIMLSLGLAVVAISRPTGDYATDIAVLSVVVFGTQRRKSRATVLWSGVGLAAGLLGASMYCAYFVPGSPAATIAVTSLATLWLSLGCQPAKAAMLLRGTWAACLVLTGLVCYDTIHPWLLIAGVMAAFINPVRLLDPDAMTGQPSEEAAKERQLIDQWWNRPVDSCYPVLLIEETTLWVHPLQQFFRQGGIGAGIITGIDTAGTMHTLGVWVSDGLGNQLSWQQIHANLTRRGLLDPIMLCCAASSDSLSCIADLWPHATMEIFDIDHYDMWKHVCDRIMPNVSSSEAEMVRVNDRHNAVIHAMRDVCYSNTNISDKLATYLRRKLYYHEATYQITIGTGWKPLMNQWAETYPHRLTSSVE